MNNKYIGYCRAKTKQNEWVQGYHIISHGESCIYSIETQSLISVVERTLCRYTGLTTSYYNTPKTDVFEYDFIVFNRGRFKEISAEINSLAPWIVLWDSKNCSFVRRRIFNNIQGFRLEAPITKDIMAECEVIGNGIDNPEVPKTSAEQINKKIQEWREQQCTTK